MTRSSNRTRAAGKAGGPPKRAAAGASGTRPSPSGAGAARKAPSVATLSLFLLPLGLVIWSSAFVGLYGLLSIGCAFGWDTMALGPASLLRWLLVALWLAHLGAIGALFLVCRRLVRGAGGRDPGAREIDVFLSRAALAATVVSLAVTIVNYAPILGLTICL